ncbi:MAG: choice-of-anchor K domain-containing protein [Geitlerinemataceae cyanobacterium]
MNDDDMTMNPTDDTVSGGMNDDTIGGGSGDDTVGGSDDDTVGGGSDDDTIGGGSDDDTVGGGSGDDAIIVGVSSGTFSKPSDITPDSVIDISSVNGGTENRFQWGVGAPESFPSVLQFDGGDLFGAKSDRPFKIGQIFYQNGTIDRSSGFNGDFAVSINLDIDGLEDDPAPFVYFFNILNTDNTTGDPVQDADDLRFSGNGLTPQTFELDGKTYTLKLEGFSQDGGNTFAKGFDSPEEGFDIANLYGRLIQVSTPNPDPDPNPNPNPNPDPDPDPVTASASYFVNLDINVVTNLQASGAVFVQGTNGAVAGSVAFQDALQLNIIWQIGVSASFSFSSSSTFNMNDAGITTIDLDAVNISDVIGSDDDDSVTGSDSNDAVSGDDGDDDISGNDGNDVLSGGDGADNLDGGAGTDCVYGNGGDDTVSGGSGNDFARGGKGNDIVDGGEGNDVLSGDSGFDILIGGGGKDTFILQATFDANEATFSTDFITDFTFGEDLICLNADVMVTFEVRDFNADGTDDVGIKLDNGSFIGFVLNTDNISQVQQATEVIPDGDFAII